MGDRVICCRQCGYYNVIYGGTSTVYDAPRALPPPPPDPLAADLARAEAARKRREKIGKVRCLTGATYCVLVALVFSLAGTWQLPGVWQFIAYGAWDIPVAAMFLFSLGATIAEATT